MTMVKISAVAALVCALGAVALAEEAKPKRSLKGNMNEVYNTLPASASSFTEAFSNGMVYGRLRANWFQRDTKEDTDANNKAFGIGGSLIYKTAPLYGVSATAGLYYADSPFESLRQDAEEVNQVKSGKDTFSRYDVKSTGNWSMASLAQAYVQYQASKTTIKAGRHFFESVLTASNDTKMIPNAFEGYSVEIKELPKTTIRGAYFYKQKLRDHTTFHDVLTFKAADGESWNNNDDSGAHQGLSYNNLKAAGEEVDNTLMVFDIKNNSIENLNLALTYTAVPNIVSSLIGEINYKLPLSGGWSIAPGVRYMQQMDNGGGEVGGAALNGSLVKWTDGAATYADNKGYASPDSLDSSLWTARLMVAKGPMKLQYGYSAVSDDADIVAPWRGFPTGGYTRAMAQLNWRANNKTHMGQLQYDFGKAKVVDGLSLLARYVIQDFDEEKQAAGGPADMTVVHVDVMQVIKAVPGLDVKFRLGVVDADDRENGKNVDGYNEYRFEANYLF
ncbi:MAG: OprD family outer membrane porin [Campylobacterales bacterium]|nr:OprD family outer membrane porin [Campylobacterales bacterium]